MPSNFSAAYAIAFCAGLYFPGAWGGLLAFSTLFATDVAINLFVYHLSAFGWFTIPNYIAYAVILLLGRRFRPQMGFFSLVWGGLLGAILFYVITNTGAWLQNPRYAKNLAGWVQALTTGLPEFPQTWEFFRNTMLGGGLFTGLFVGAVKLGEKVQEDESETSEEPSATGDEAQA